MFQKKIDNIKKWLCSNSKFLELKNPAFDDRHHDPGFFIEELDGITDFQQSTSDLWVIGRRKFRLYMQFTSADPYNVVAALLYNGACNDLQVIELNDDSKQVFEGVNKDNKFNNNGFNFAYITFEISELLRKSDCKLC